MELRGTPIKGKRELVARLWGRLTADFGLPYGFEDEKQNFIHTCRDYLGFRAKKHL